MRYKKSIDFKKVGRRVKIKREQAGFTQNAIAEQADIDSKYWSAIENGNLPSVGLGAIYSIAYALNCNLDYFFVDSIKQNKDATYEEISDLLNEMTPDQRVIAMDLVKFVFDNRDKIS